MWRPYITASISILNFKKYEYIWLKVFDLIVNNILWQFQNFWKLFVQNFFIYSFIWNLYIRAFISILNINIFDYKVSKKKIILIWLWTIFYGNFKISGKYSSRTSSSIVSYEIYIQQLSLVFWISFYLNKLKSYKTFTSFRQN